MSFKLSLRQERARSRREQRTALYVEMLAEAYAEQEYLAYDLADDDTREHMRTYFTDLRLPPRERAQLGARGTAMASRPVNAAFNKLQAAALRAVLKTPRDEGVRMVARVEVAGAREELEAAVRRELGTDSTSDDAGTRDRLHE